MSPANIDPARVLVTGAEGMIGRALNWGIKFRHSELDITDRRQFERAILRHRPAAVLHLAALDLRQCAANPSEAFRTNVLGTTIVAETARDAGVQVTLLSTGGVFNGPAGTLHDETAQPEPVNLYGHTKRTAEVALTRTCENSLVVRTGWLFGSDQAHHRRFVERAIDLARRGEPIQGTTDQQGSPTWVVDLVDRLLPLICGGARGIVHVANEGISTGYDLATEIVRILKSRSEVLPVRGADLADSGPRRAASEALATRGKPLRPWQEALREHVLRAVGEGSGGQPLTRGVI